jgi:hypothetical protein
MQQVQYAYYDGAQQYGGNLGDLMKATVERKEKVPGAVTTSCLTDSELLFWLRAVGDWRGQLREGCNLATVVFSAAPTKRGCGCNAQVELRQGLARMIHERCNGGASVAGVWAVCRATLKIRKASRTVSTSRLIGSGPLFSSLLRLFFSETKTPLISSGRSTA